MIDKENLEVNVIIEQPRTEVYYGTYGHIVIKQEDEYQENIVLITEENLETLINILDNYRTVANND